MTRVLNPVDRLSEILFGLYMAVSITGSLSVVGAGRDDVRTMLIAAIGCNIAWGLVDGVMYVVRCLVDRNREMRVLRDIRAATNKTEAAGLLTELLPDSILANIKPDALSRVHETLAAQPEPPLSSSVTAEDLRGGLAVFLMVFLSTLPIVLPFFFTNEVGIAMRQSNVIAMLMLFAAGWQFGRYAGIRPLLMGVVMCALGVALIGAVIALGG